MTAHSHTGTTRPHGRHEPSKQTRRDSGAYYLSKDKRQSDVEIAEHGRPDNDTILKVHLIYMHRCFLISRGGFIGDIFARTQRSTILERNLEKADSINSGDENFDLKLIVCEVEFLDQFIAGLRFCREMVEMEEKYTRLDASVQKKRMDKDISDAEKVKSHLLRKELVFDPSS